MGDLRRYFADPRGEHPVLQAHSAGTYHITLNHQPAAALGGIGTVHLAGYKLVANAGWDSFNNRWFVVTTDGGSYVDMPFAVISLGGG
ncbi:MAG: hypothetical protein EXR72_20320 [Myxococcales bacterium]|nr:hypothetical protein [Myxococcales bacterium]